MIRLGFLFRQKKRSLNWIEKHRRTSMLTIVRKKYSLITQHGFVCGMWTMQANWNEIVKWSRTENKRLISSKHKWVNKLEIKTHRQYNWSGISCASKYNVEQLHPHRIWWKSSKAIGILFGLSRKMKRVKIVKKYR